MAQAARRGEAQAWAQTAAHYTGDDCLLWPFKAKMTSGYGSIKTSNPRKQVGVHRFVCELAKGPAPMTGMECAHSCGVKMCCNPKHLRWTTHVENEADKAIHGTKNTGSRNGAAKLTTADVLKIREQHCSGSSGRDLSRHYGVSPASISLIVNKHNWSWL